MGGRGRFPGVFFFTVFRVFLRGFQFFFLDDGFWEFFFGMVLEVFVCLLGL